MNMSTTDLHRYLKELMPVNIHTAVYSADQLKECPAAFFTIIVNNEEAHLPGGHWLAFSRLHNSNLIEFFDSFAQPWESYGVHFNKFITENCSKIKFNTIQVQENDTASCGAFCLYYLVHRVLGYKLEEIINSFDLSNLENNTTLVLGFLQSTEAILGNRNDERTDVKCSINQLCRSCTCENN